MNIGYREKIQIVLAAYSINDLLPNMKKRLGLFLRPFDATRYVEFAYLYAFISKNRLHNLDILDVSSPHILSYILSKNNRVLKTNIDSAEKAFIKENKNLHFKIEDATKLSFKDNSFDLVYSISVIEHIHENFLQAIQEMIRVTKPGGYIYLTFPISRSHKEEWLEEQIYSHQYTQNNKYFFQYRFDSKDIEKISMAIRKQHARFLEKDIFWERKDGMYDTLIKKMRSTLWPNFLNKIKIILVNVYYGQTLFTHKPSLDFSNEKSFGNIHLLLQKDD